MHHLSTILVAVLSLTSAALATPARLESRAAADNTVHINSKTDYCMILPRQQHTNIGDSEHPGGMRSFCTNPTGNQGKLSSNFWTEVYMSKKPGRSGARQIQLTGCINPRSTPQLNPRDDGGQYDSNGGDGGQGNPRGSVCAGYASYVELVEPSANRACIRCCDKPSDCDLSRDTSGCPAVIKGNYGRCG